MESVFEGVDSLKIMLEDAEFAETGAQDRCAQQTAQFLEHSPTLKSTGQVLQMVGVGEKDTAARLRTT